MKNAFLFFISTLIFTSCLTQKKLNEDIERTLTKIIEVDGVNKDELFVKANTWIAKTFVSAEQVIEYSDKEAGRIIGNWVFKFSDPWLGGMAGKTTITIDVKDNKCRIEYSQPLTAARNIKGISSSFTKSKTKYLHFFEKEWNNINSKFEKAIREKEEDW